MAGHILQDFPFPAEIFHELTRQFDGIPFHSIYPRHAEHIYLGEQMMQAMSELVEQGDDFIMCEQRLLRAEGQKQLCPDLPEYKINLFESRQLPSGEVCIEERANARSDLPLRRSHGVVCLGWRPGRPVVAGAGSARRCLLGTRRW